MTEPKRQLRFGVMCSGADFPQWQAQCLTALLKLEGVKPALLIVDSRPPASSSSVWKRLKTLLALKVSLFSLYNRYRIQKQCRATKPVCMSSFFEGVPQIACEINRKGKFSEYFKEDDLVVIRSHDLDFILRFGFNIIRGEILTAPRYGVWSFHHGDEQQYRGAPPCFWEIYQHNPKTGCILQRLTERLDGGIILRAGTFATIFHSYSQSRDAAHRLGINWPAEVCQDLQQGKAAYLDAPSSTSKAPIYVAPRNGQMIAFAIIQVRHKLANYMRYMRRSKPARTMDPHITGAFEPRPRMKQP